MPPTLPEALLGRLSGLLAAHLGLHYPRERWADLERGIAAAASRMGLSGSEDFARRLLSAPLTHREIEGLAADLTVGETYFFREKASLDALEQYVLPALLRSRANGPRRLRIWSAGCCTGEEPYTLAMLLDRLLPADGGWNVTILGTDVNPGFLRAAAEAEYGEWAFRETPPWVRERYFQRVRAGRYRLRDHIRGRVGFAFLNLADEAYPAPVGDGGAVDLILCRNVLMYFTAERARAAADKFHRALAPDGWLVVSPAETSATLFSAFSPVRFDGATLYRKEGDGAMAGIGFAWPAPALPAATPAAVPDWFLDAVPAPEPVAVAVPTAVPAFSAPVEPAAAPAADPGALRQAARECANMGRLEEAAGLCREAIAADRIDATGHYLLGTIEEALGRADEGAQSLARALYLAPDFVLAHFALGHLRQSQGRVREAQRHFDNALAVLSARPPGETVAEADGLTVARLIEIVGSLRSSLPQIAA